MDRSRCKKIKSKHIRLLETPSTIKDNNLHSILEEEEGREEEESCTRLPPKNKNYITGTTTRTYDVNAMPMNVLDKLTEKHVIETKVKEGYEKKSDL